MVVGTPFFGATAVVIAIIAAAIVFLVTARTHRGSILDRRERRVRWKDRRRAGIDRYTPFDVAQWDQLTQLTQDKTASKQDRWAAARDLAAMRTMPDGADGMGWLQMGRREPGIAWHAPMGEKPYLSVVFTVTGQLRGAEPNSVARRAAEAFGEFLASRAAPSSLLRRVQVTTRVLPPDNAFNAAWAEVSLDPTIPTNHPAVLSYGDVLRTTVKPVSALDASSMPCSPMLLVLPSGPPKSTISALCSSTHAFHAAMPSRSWACRVSSGCAHHACARGLSLLPMKTARNSF